jgi:hypothetical protein
VSEVFSQDGLMQSVFLSGCWWLAIVHCIKAKCQFRDSA